MMRGVLHYHYEKIYDSWLAGNAVARFLPGLEHGITESRTCFM